MNLIFGTIALLSLQCFGVFGDCLVKPSDFDEFMKSCASCFTARRPHGQGTRANSRPYELFFSTAGAGRYELLLRPEEKNTEVGVDVKVYHGHEANDASSLAIKQEESYSAVISRDCFMNITILQPGESRKNAEVIFSATDKLEEVPFNSKNVTFIGLKVSSNFRMCSLGSREDCNGHNNNCGGNGVEETRNETQVAAAGSRKAHSNSTTGGCNNTVTTVLGILLAVSLLINKFFVIRIGLRKICSRRSDEGPNANPARRPQGLGHFPRANSTHDSENSVYGAVINRK